VSATDVPLVWLDTQKHGEAASAELAAWARSRGVTLTGPSDDSRRTLAYPESVAAQIEAELTRAREATTALDAEGADRSLERAESTLLAHPELPQAAFLLAEVLRARAARASTVAPKDPELALASLREARGLDGGRKAALGEEEGPPPELVSVEITAPESGELHVDGVPRSRSAGKTELSRGRHHVVLMAFGRAVWASWVTATPDARIEAPEVRTPCSRQDFDGVGLRGAHVSAPKTTCGDWVAASHHDQALFVARCSQSTCGPLIEWRVRLPVAPLVPRYQDHSIPSWIGWSSAGVLAVVATSIALVASGAFETAPQTTRFSYGGVVQR
jgi:hypothetical protein